jgi:hypothetical protein
MLLEMAPNGQLVNANRGTYVYEANGKLLSYLYCRWINSSWVPDDSENREGYRVTDGAGNHYSFSGHSATFSYRLLVTGITDNNSSIPEMLFLSQNYPNPFNPTTTISFSFPSRSFVSLKVFDVMGRDVATIVSEEMPAGNYSRQWNAAGMPSGVYFFRLHAGAYTETKKLLLLR